MSTDKGFLGWGGECPDSPHDAECRCKGTGYIAGDEKPLRYLYEMKHSTPFELGGLTVEVMAPIFVFREWHRHRTASYSEMSARYVPLPDVNYIPTIERLMINSKSNKQAGVIKGADELTEETAQMVREELEFAYTTAENRYQTFLNMGVPKELARIHLPVGRYSKMRASANLRNWLGFLTLRMDPKAQYEIRVYAEAIATIIAEKFPRTYELFVEGRNK
jgi:thymidylate synthase (FAD)